MKTFCLVLMLVLSCAFVLAVAGCGTSGTAAGPAAESPSKWVDLNPSGDVPSARDCASMVDDPGTGRVILFGGWSAVDTFDDTWAYDPAGNTWADLNPAGGVPVARAYPQLVFDPTTGRVILFGGADDDGRLLNDTWTYDLAANTWTQLTPAGDLPLARVGEKMVYAAGSGQAILFGGFTGGQWASDTWGYDSAANTWTDLNPAGEVPSAREDHSMVYDPGTGRVILFGGDSAANGDANDTWAYDPAANTWTQLTPAGDVPAARHGHGMIYDAHTGKVVLFGGYNDKTEAYLNDTWAYDPAANTWTELHPSGDRPSTRSAHSIVYNQVTGKVFLFGGGAGSDRLSDTWSFGS